MAESEVKKYNIINNTRLMHFESHPEGDIAFLEYRYHNNSIVLMHTEVPGSMEGKGIASSLAKYAFNFAKEKNLTVKVYCPFVLTYLKKHPELNVQLEKSR